MTKKGKFDTYAPQDLNGADLVGVFEPGSAAWHEARADGLGGSEVGAVLGLNKYESAFSLWAKKSGLVETEPVNNWAVRFGKAFEEPLLELFAEQHPELTIFLTGTYRDGVNKFMTANPDALAHNAATNEWHVVEIKTARYSWDEVPPSYVAQINHYMDILKIKTAVIAGISGWDYVEQWYELDSFEAQAQRDSACRFWDCILSGEAPNWDGSDATYEALRKLHPDIEDREIEISGGHLLVLAKREMDAAKAKFDDERNIIMGLMGQARHAVVEHDGERFRIATRQARGSGAPFLIVKDGK